MYRSRSEWERGHKTRFGTTWTMQSNAIYRFKTIHFAGTDNGRCLMNAGGLCQAEAHPHRKHFSVNRPGGCFNWISVSSSMALVQPPPNDTTTILLTNSLNRKTLTIVVRNVTTIELWNLSLCHSILWHLLESVLLCDPISMNHITMSSNNKLSLSHHLPSQIRTHRWTEVLFCVLEWIPCFCCIFFISHWVFVFWKKKI